MEADKANCVVKQKNPGSGIAGIIGYPVPDAKDFIVVGATAKAARQFEDFINYGSR
jgi:hypothetical protein